VLRTTTSGLLRESRPDQRSPNAGLPVALAQTDRLLSIGVFARRSRLSLNALRLYERLGLLLPAHVDRGVGYRQCRESQRATARLVAMLRRLDMPLARVAEVVSIAGPQASELVAIYWESVERRIASQRELGAHPAYQALGSSGVRRGVPGAVRRRASSFGLTTPSGHTVPRRNRARFMPKSQASRIAVRGSGCSAGPPCQAQP
jgi:DNA-binding transcriptional MerR regulator